MINYDYIAIINLENFRNEFFLFRIWEVVFFRFSEFLHQVTILGGARQSITVESLRKFHTII